MMRLQDFVKSAVPLYKSGTAIHLVSPPGVGKSDVTKNEFRAALSAAYGEEFGYHDVLLPTIDAPDIRGFLIPTKDANGKPTSFFTRSAVLPSEDYLKKHPRGVMLLDERNAADMLTQKAVAPAVLSRRFGEDYLPEGWLIVSASNRMEDRAGVNKPPSHLVNRERTLVIEPDVNSWQVWAEAQGLHPMMIAFARKNPGVVFSPDVPKKEGPFCTPRSFVSAAKLLANMAGVDDQGRANMDIPVNELTLQMVAGDIGDGASSQLFAFLKVADQLPTIDEIEADPKNCKCPTELSGAYAAGQMCVAYGHPDNIDKLWQYAERLPKELQVATAKSLLPKGGGMLLNSKALSSWISKNKALINASNK
jgi:hypothetical protein